MDNFKINNSNDTNIPARALTVKQLMCMLQIGRSKAYELIKSGEIRSIRIGNCIRIPLSAVEEYLNADIKE